MPIFERAIVMKLPGGSKLQIAIRVKINNIIVPLNDECCMYVLIALCCFFSNRVETPLFFLHQYKDFLLLLYMHLTTKTIKKQTRTLAC